MPTGIGREETMRIRSNRKKDADDVLPTTENLTNRPRNNLQDHTAFDELYNAQNVWFLPHIRYFSLKKGPDFKFSEKIKLKHALDKITKVVRLADVMLKTIEVPFRIKNRNEETELADVETIKAINQLFHIPNMLLTITDLRDPNNPDYINKSPADKLIMEQKISRLPLRVFKNHTGLAGGFPVYLMSDFFKVGLTAEQRATILYRSFVEASDLMDTRALRSVSALVSHPAVLLFEDILAWIKVHDKDAWETQVTLHDANEAKESKKFLRGIEASETLVAERSKGYTIFPAYDQETPSSETSKPQVMKKAIKRAVHKTSIV